MILIVAMAAGAAGVAGAGLPPPSWMPNSPILAGTQLIVLWLPVPGAVKYNVYINDKKVGDSPSVQLILPAPEEAGEYRIQIAAVDAGGAEGAKSTPGVIKIITVEPPKGIISRVAENKVLLRWDKAKGAVIYNVFRADKKDGEYTLQGSVQGEDFVDSTTQKGKIYFYAIASKDLAGKESKRSEPVMVSLVEAVAAQAALRFKLKVVPSKEVSQILFLGKQKITQYGDFKIGPDGFGYVVDAGSCLIHKVDLASGDVVLSFGERGVGEGKLGQPSKLAFTKGGRIYVGDVVGKVVVYDTAGNYKFEFKMPPPDKEKDKAVYENSMELVRGSAPPASGLAIDEEGDTLYVASSGYNTILAFTLAGQFKGYIGYGGTTGLFVIAPSEILFGKTKTELLVTQPPNHDISVIDVKEKKIVDTIGMRRTGFVGAFIGVNGAAVTPQGNFLFCDSGVHSIQVFDKASHNYLYHIGGEVPMADPEFKDRAKFDFPYAVGANFDAAGKLYVLNGLKRYISVREVYWDKAVEPK